MSGRNLLSLASAIAVLALGGCNAVLGIEEAHQVDDIGSKSFNAGSRNTPMFAADCTNPSSACASCLDRNDCNVTARPACLGNSACRGGLNNYRSCLGNPCSDDAGECLTSLAGAESKLGTAFGFSQCAQNTCQAECHGSPLVTPCELYCGCMVDHCADKLAKTTLGVSFAACVTSCTKSLSPDDVLCRWTHCEMAPSQVQVNHCGHAIGESNFCSGQIASAPTCLDRTQDGLVCGSSSDCCSNNCDSSNICQSSQ